MRHLLGALGRKFESCRPDACCGWQATNFAGAGWRRPSPLDCFTLPACCPKANGIRKSSGGKTSTTKQLRDVVGGRFVRLDGVGLITVMAFEARGL